MLERTTVSSDLREYSFTPSDLNHPTPDQLVNLFDGPFRLHLGSAANRYVQLCQEIASWGPFPAEQITNYFQEARLNYSFWTKLVSSGHFVPTEDGYLPTPDFVAGLEQTLGKVTKPSLD